MDTKIVINLVKEILGVNGISILEKDGTVLNSYNFSNQDNSLLGYTGTAINDSAEMFNLGHAKKAVIKGPGYKILIVIINNNYFGVTMNEDADEDHIEHSICTAILKGG